MIIIWLLLNQGLQKIYKIWRVSMDIIWEKDTYIDNTKDLSGFCQINKYTTNINVEYPSTVIKDLSCFPDQIDIYTNNNNGGEGEEDYNFV